MIDHIKVIQQKTRALQYFSLECERCRIWIKQTILVWLKNPNKTAIKKIKVRLHKKQLIPSYCTLLWFKTEILAHKFFDQNEYSLWKPKIFHKWTRLRSRRISTTFPFLALDPKLAVVYCMRETQIVKINFCKIVILE